MNQSNYILIMAGGVGSRFWPKSRIEYPKQFIDILGVGKSFLQLTVERFKNVAPQENIFIVTNEQYRELVKEQLPHFAAEQIICEPSRNNTAPCVAYASFKLFAKNPNANVVVAPSDHFILKEEVFVEKILSALEFTATNDSLLTLGITPTRPDTGYGYINYMKTDAGAIKKVIRFTEKPKLEKAQEFLISGDYVWNAGIFIWNVKSALKAFQQNSPEIYELFKAGMVHYNTSSEKAFVDEFYPQSANISIDYAIMEKADNVFTLPADFGWSDLGTWASLYEVAEKDENQNVSNSDQILSFEAEGNIMHLPEGKKAVVKGLNNFIIVDDKDVLLIYPKELEQEIKQVSEQVALL
ncbi:mannose-1-phosphate guanylyltransferase [Solitalea lacus]|uniref:mannose-1-phosphate guanylyltransferase n=1 Tax=Solitalea lacus TaxID=2911172 RepID=UPI001EDB9A47|nr:mannose-1-phosphate guanylyltransferase [Solitalea lacus]UKJ08264.1 mannose-1-phosphate guanylyltransferase [Solitalea lacus]